MMRMPAADTEDRIRRRLALLEPSILELTDDSAAHAGHAGAASGGGHYCLTIVSAHFKGRSRVARHRLVYDALGPLMHREIHALALITRAPDEPAPIAS